MPSSGIPAGLDPVTKKQTAISAVPDTANPGITRLAVDLGGANIDETGLLRILIAEIRALRQDFAAANPHGRVYSPASVLTDQ